MWILITRRFLYLMTAGKDTWELRQPADGKAYSLPETWQDRHKFSSIVVDLDRPAEPAAATAAPPPPTPARPGGIPLTPPRVNPPILWMSIANRPPNGGLIQFTLTGLAGENTQSWSVYSGARGAQEIDKPERDWPGSNRPIPHGAYKLGPIERHPSGNWGPGLGPIWIDLVPILPKNRRSAIGLHLDANFRSSPGSAGCVVHPELKIIESICAWISRYKPQHIVVDYGFGLDEERAELGIK